MHSILPLSLIDSLFRSCRRRQWKPTFATEDENGKLDDDFKPPDDLSKLSFASGDKVQSQGIMSFKDLDESHLRKERLLSAKPLGGSLWDEAETSKAASARSAKANNATIPGASSEATNYGKKPGALRTASFQSAKSAKKFFGGGKTSAPSQAMPPLRNSSARAVNASSEKDSVTPKTVPPRIAEGGAPVVTEMPPPVVATDVDKILEEGPASTTHLETTATQYGARPETIAGDDADKTLTANDVEKIPLAKAKDEAEDAGVVSEIPQSLDTEVTEEVKADDAAAGTASEVKVDPAVDAVHLAAPPAAQPVVEAGTQSKVQ